MAYTFSKIASVTVGSGGASSIDFLAIPQNYTDLMLVHSTRTNDSSWYNTIAMEFNNDTTSANYNFLYLYANSSSPASGSGTVKYAGYGNGASATANTFGNAEVYIPNYTSSTQKPYSTNSVVDANSFTAGQYILALHSGKWSNTSAITSIKLIPGSGNFAQYSTATLYGIKAEV
jgi:hypothetical protein